jgi:hypothetical protein
MASEELNIPTCLAKQKAEPPKSFGSPAIRMRDRSTCWTRWLCALPQGKVALLGILNYETGPTLGDTRPLESAPVTKKPAATRSRLHHWLLVAQVPTLARRFLASTSGTSQSRSTSIPLRVYERHLQKASPDHSFAVKIRLREMRRLDSLARRA